jgi:ketosteroid isomerase-like protein
VSWEFAALDLPDVGTTQFRGPAGVREFFRRWVGPFDEWGYEVREAIDAGDSVVGHSHQWGRGKGSGATVESRFRQVLTLCDGKIVRAAHRSEKAQALDAVGLSE